MITRRGLFGLLVGAAVCPDEMSKKTEKYEIKPYSMPINVPSDVYGEVISPESVVRMIDWRNNQLIEAIRNQVYDGVFDD